MYFDFSVLILTSLFQFENRFQKIKLEPCFWLILSSFRYFDAKLMFNGIIQKKSVSGSKMLPCLVIFFKISFWSKIAKKWFLNRGTLISATAIYQTKYPFQVLSALFLFFQMLLYNSKLLPDVIKVYWKAIFAKIKNW